MAGAGVSQGQGGSHRDLSHIPPASRGTAASSAASCCHPVAAPRNYTWHGGRLAPGRCPRVTPARQVPTATRPHTWPQRAGLGLWRPQQSPGHG